MLFDAACQHVTSIVPEVATVEQLRALMIQFAPPLIGLLQDEPHPRDAVLFSFLARVQQRWDALGVDSSDATRYEAWVLMHAAARCAAPSQHNACYTLVRPQFI